MIVKTCSQDSAQCQVVCIAICRMELSNYYERQLWWAILKPSLSVLYSEIERADDAFSNILELLVVPGGVSSNSMTTNTNRPNTKSSFIFHIGWFSFHFGHMSNNPRCSCIGSHPLKPIQENYWYRSFHSPLGDRLLSISEIDIALEVANRLVLPFENFCHSSHF